MDRFMLGLRTRGAAAGRVGMAVAALTLLASPYVVLAQDETAPNNEPAVSEPGMTDEEIAEQQAAREQAEADALASELASAQRMKEQLDAALLPDGRVGADTRDEVVTRLAGLVTRCGVLANSAMYDQTRLALLGYQARALAALAPLENTEQGPGQSSRLEQLREVAEQIRQLDVPNAEPTGDYWHLLADLAVSAQAGGTVAARQALAEELLISYIEANAGKPAATEFLIDTRLSLARMMDERGDQRGAAELLDAIGKLPKNSPRQAEVKQLRKSIERLDTPIQFESVTSRLEVWRSADHIGKPVLIHVYADTAEPSVQMIESINEIIGSGLLSGIAIVSLRVGEPVAGTTTPPWPTLPVQLEKGGVLDQLGVTSLPTLAWLDSKGRLASIGHTISVLEQHPADNAEPAEVDAEGVDASEPDPAANEANTEADEAP